VLDRALDDEDAAEQRQRDENGHDPRDRHHDVAAK
jgi:hypothetical protein